MRGKGRMVAAFRVEGGSLSKGEWNDRRTLGEVSSPRLDVDGTGLKGKVVMILGAGVVVGRMPCPYSC